MGKRRGLVGRGLAAAWVAALLAACAGGDAETTREASPPSGAAAGSTPAAVDSTPAADGRSAASPRTACDGGESGLPSLVELEPAALDRALRAAHDRHPDFDERLRALVLARIGIPYALGTLGEENEADPDPVFRLDEADCTVLVLTTTAAAHARSIEEARAWMGPANYRERDGAFAVSYENRLHFTSDRLRSSPLFADLTRKLVRPQERRRVQVTLNRNAKGESLLDIDWQRALEMEYIPTTNLEPVLERLPPVAGIAFVREAWSRRGLLVAHEGFLLDQRCLVHASSEAERVVAVDVMDYLWRRADPDSTRRGTARFDGAVLYAILDGTGRVDPSRTVFAAAEGERR